MDVLKETVRHRQFGSGTIIGQTASSITVEFCKEYGIRKFCFPSAFESFLELCDPEVKQKMDTVLHVNQEREKFERQRRIEEDERRREEERIILLEEKRLAAKEKRKQTKR